MRWVTTTIKARVSFRCESFPCWPARPRSSARSAPATCWWAARTSATTRHGSPALPRCSEPALRRQHGKPRDRRRSAAQAAFRRTAVHRSLRLIRELKPDVVITQTHCEVCVVTPANVGCPIDARQVVLSASSLEEIFEGILRIARGLGLEQRGQELVTTRKGPFGKRAAADGARLSRPRLVVL